MKSILSFILFLWLFVSCTSDQDNQTKMELTIRIQGKPSCKGSKVNDNSQSCVQYAFDQDNRMFILKHVNAAFNCCPDSIWCTIAYSNDTIIIQEFEKNFGCKCDCLYDLNLEISGLEPEKYYLKFVEPYSGDQDQLWFPIDLTDQKQGECCVARSLYRW